MPKFSHVFEIVFSVHSEKRDASDVDADALWDAVRKRFSGMGHEEIDEAVIHCADATLELENT